LRIQYFFSWESHFQDVGMLFALVFMLKEVLGMKVALTMALTAKAVIVTMPQEIS